MRDRLIAAERAVSQERIRIAREMHAGDSAVATVTLRFTERALEVTIADTGRGAVSSLNATGSVNGLIGMRERVEAYDSSFSAGPRTGGGYLVSVTLPTDESKVRTPLSVADYVYAAVRAGASGYLPHRS